MGDSVSCVDQVPSKSFPTRCRCDLGGSCSSLFEEAWLGHGSGSDGVCNSCAIPATRSVRTALLPLSALQLTACIRSEDPGGVSEHACLHTSVCPYTGSMGRSASSACLPYASAGVHTLPGIPQSLSSFWLSLVSSPTSAVSWGHSPRKAEWWPFV